MLVLLAVGVIGPVRRASATGYGPLSVAVRRDPPTPHDGLGLTAPRRLRWCRTQAGYDVRFLPSLGISRVLSSGPGGLEALSEGTRRDRRGAGKEVTMRTIKHSAGDEQGSATACSAGRQADFSLLVALCRAFSRSHVAPPVEAVEGSDCVGVQRDR